MVYSLMTKREKLAELICEYIDDEQYTARGIYEEFLSVLGSEIQGREATSKKASEVRDLLMGYRVSDAFPSQFEV